MTDTMNAEQRKELWRWAVHNRVFDLTVALSEIRSTLTALGGDALMTHDKWIVAERQLRICELEVDNLRKMVGNIRFEPSDFLSVAEAQEKHVCRICQKDGEPHPPDNPFILNHGKEYAHQKCLESIGVVVS